MKKIIFISSLILSNILYAQGEKQTEITQSDIKIQNELSLPQEKEVTTKDIQDYFDEFANAHNIEYGVTENGRTFYYGYADISDKGDLARGGSIAFQKAMLNIQSEFIKDAFGRLANQRILKYLNDNSTNAREFEELEKGGVLSQIMDKVTQLTGAKLDSALKDLGIEVEGLSQERKKDIFKDEFITKTIIDASGQMSGLVPMQTYVTTTKNGNYRVGVVAVISNKTRAIADDIKKNRQSNIKGKGKKLEEFLPKEDKDYINEYGIRMVYDENGEPMIISYGIWGYGKTSSDSRILDRLESGAKETAQNQADIAIREFVSTQISLRDETQTGDIIKQTLKESQNINNGSKEITEEMISEIVDKSLKTITSKTKGNLRGIRTAKRWSYTDNNTEYVGIIRVYSYKNYVNTTQAVSPIKQEHKKVTTKPQTREQDKKSSIVNSIDDF
ncbi:DUF6844 domain-containing protein [Helicobacter sp. WB40]|uniref:DUF6844 domain-containing protein n=1 Tax=Helicobacter sp. WB40 TaxID=3004130 RepID=UPI0022EBAF78|nr:hypothetical protein [Helicobacter sp. WB40]MDA3967915.1 hypothetical protein [Helicobacter sp. WB40]